MMFFCGSLLGMGLNIQDVKFVVVLLYKHKYLSVHVAEPFWVRSRAYVLGDVSCFRMLPLASL
jgi:hypothetical protein